VPLLISVAPNGARRSKADHPGLPVTAEHIAKVAASCQSMGAALLHLHVRDAQGAHSLDPRHYQDTIAQVAKLSGDSLLIQITTEACGIYDVGTQMAVVRAVRPAAASFAIREYFGSAPPQPEVVQFFSWIHEAGIAAQFILYSPGEIAQLQLLIANGVIRAPRPHALFVLGRHARDQQSDPQDLLAFVQSWPRDWPWSVCAFGRSELAVAAVAIGLGGWQAAGRQ
jgi:uncharacterized protein (DUF849 family)